MFAELIFVALAILGLFVIDNFSTPLAVVICGLAVYCYLYCFSFSLNRHLVFVLFISKVWGCLAYAHYIVKRTYCFIKELIFTKSADDAPEESRSYCCGETAKLENEINVIVLNISQCYIHSWYNKISDNEDFVLHLNCCIRETLTHLCSGVSKIDRKKFSFVIMQLYLHYFTHIVDAKQKSGKFKLENFQMRHWAIKDNLTEWCYLQSLVSTLIDTFGPKEYHNTFHSTLNPLLHAVVVEILAENVIYPLLHVLSDPVRLNSWILKLLMNYVMKQEQTEVISMDGISHKNNILNPDSCYGIKPQILLPAEDSFVNYVIENKSMNDASDNTLTIPPEAYAEGSSEEFNDVFPRKLSDIGAFEDLPNFIGTGLKSSSNINLLSSDFSDTKDVCSERNLPVSCDTSTIKRSKSADYIRQMPQLKALNIKEYNIVLQSENNKMLVALRPDASPNNLVEQAEEAVEIEVPTLFTDVKITGTQQQSEAGLVPYILYCIQYSGVFHDTSSETPHFVKQVVSIKRRFREFLALQSRLEDNPSLKNYLKGIKGPSKGFPFSNLDKKNIAERKSFLENYLKELCSQGPIAQSSELQQFLAYGGDARIAFVKKAVDIGVPRIDKMLVRGVKGAIDMFRTALPNSPIEGGCSDSNFSLNPKPTYEDASPECRFQEHLLEFSSKEPEIKEIVVPFLESHYRNCACIFLYDMLKIPDYNERRLLRSRCSINIDESCMCTQTTNVKDIFILDENPFGDTVLELLLEAVKLNNLDKTCILSIGKLLFSSYINRFVINKIEKVSEEQFAICLHLLHNALWPDEKSQDENKMKPESSSQMKKIMECLEIFLAENYIFMNMSYTLRKFVLSKINLLLSSIQHQESNRCLLFHFFDVVIETLCSKEE